MKSTSVPLTAYLADGTPIRSTLGGTIYTNAKKVEPCAACGRGPKFFAGCSCVECPQRRPVTARPTKMPSRREE